VLVAAAGLEPSQIQDLGDVMPKLLEIKAKSNTLIRFHVRIEFGDTEAHPKEEAVSEVNQILRTIKEDFELH
jgi:hypothetical protein